MSRSLKRRLERELKKINRKSAHSLRAAELYRSGITSADLIHPEISPRTRSVLSRYPLLSNEKTNLLNRAEKERIELSDWYSTPVHPLTGSDLKAVGYEEGSCPNAESVGLRIVHLPTHFRTTDRDIDRVVEFLNGFFE